jgi:hypothetical protein
LISCSIIFICLGRTMGCGWREVLWVQRVAANILNKQSQTDDKERSSSLGVGRGADNPSL